MKNLLKIFVLLAGIATLTSCDPKPKPVSGPAVDVPGDSVEINEAQNPVELSTEDTGIVVKEAVVEK